MERSEHECNVELSLALVPSQGNQSNDMVLKPLQVLLPQLNLQDRQQSKRPRLVEEETSYNSCNEEGSRKKLRLTQEQASMLENAFEEHTTLNVYQKHELAEKLNLKPRQVEVWFQNRRARNKTKQTEVEFELLKKWCEILKEENLRLKNSLKELSSKDSCGHNGTASGKKSNCTEDSSVDY